MRERINAVVIGAGQAGLAASHELSARGIEHVVLERGVVGQTWRTQRWRSFRIVSPNSLNLLPGYEYDGPEPDAFLDTTGLLAYLEGYAASFGAPVRTGISVVEIRPADGRGYRVKMDGSQLEADHVVVATGASAIGACLRWPRTSHPGSTRSTWPTIGRPKTSRPAACSSWARDNRDSKSPTSWRAAAVRSSSPSAGTAGSRGVFTVGTRCTGAGTTVTIARSSPTPIVRRPTIRSPSWRAGAWTISTCAPPGFPA